MSNDLTQKQSDMNNPAQLMSELDSYAKGLDQHADSMKPGATHTGHSNAAYLLYRAAFIMRCAREYVAKLVAEGKIALDAAEDILNRAETAFTPKIERLDPPQAPAQPPAQPPDVPVPQAKKK